jgi:hypothetical protein
MPRGDGATTRQMESAPKGSIFVWCNGHTDYPRKLAKKINRDDLVVESPTWLEERWRGLELTGVVVDHSARLTDRQWDGYKSALTRVRPRGELK